MLRRCYTPEDASYKSYGAKGIRVAGDWIRDIRNFKNWLLEAIRLAGLSVETFVQDSKYWQIDRIDGSGHYTPENCRVVRTQHNQRNKPGIRNTFISAEGETISLAA
jgi:hypothetical protein